MCIRDRNGGNFNALDFAAGQTGVHFAVQIVVGTQADLRQIAAAGGFGQRIVAGGNAQQIPHLQALETLSLIHI